MRCDLHFSPRRIELRALRNISEGEELSVSYIDFLDTSAERQRKLKEHFYFECTCEHCRQHLKDDLMTAAAAHGDGGNVSDGDDAGFHFKAALFPDSLLVSPALQGSGAGGDGLQ